MVGLNVPETAGMPVAWWLFWFVAALVVYAILMTWFYRTGRRETRDPRSSAGDKGDAAR